MVVALQLVLCGCDSKQSAATQASVSLAPIATQAPKVPVPAEFNGNWRLTSIDCEKDSDERPPKHLPHVFLQIVENGTWYIDV
jgi:hypothetical protein